MRKTGNLRRLVSGLMAGMTLLTSLVSPMTVYAEEYNPNEVPPLYQDVKDLLDADEVVTAKDLELEYGSPFDVTYDFSNLEIPDNTKVKVSFHEAKNAAGEDFSAEHADTYKSVYYVEPTNTEHPKYQISRNLIVKESVTEEVEVQAEAAEAQIQPEAAAPESEESASTAEETDGETYEYSNLDVGILLDGYPEESDVITEPETETTEQETTTEIATESEATSEASSETDTAMEESVPTGFDGEMLSEEELDAALEAAEDQVTVDPETGLSVSDVLMEAEEQGLDLFDLEMGETMTYEVEASAMLLASASAKTQYVDVTRGTGYSYADYGLGSYVTYSYKVKFGSVSATAYCVQPSKGSPGDGTFQVTKLKDSKTLAKVCYYGTKAAGDEGFFAEKHPDFSAGKRFIITHIAAAYANGSGDAFSGTNSTGQSLAMELYNFCTSQPEIPDVDMNFTNDSPKAYIDGNEQRTEEITFKADTLQSITFKLPNGVKLHNVTTGKTSKAGADVEIGGGTKFYLSAPLTQASDVSGSWSSKMKGSVTKDYSAYKITTGSSTQDLALVFGEGVDDEKYVTFSVTWVQQASVSIVKRDSVSGKALAGAVYGIYADEAGTNLIAQMPATDANGASSVTLTKTQDTVYLKEISGPVGYLIDVQAYNINLVVGSDVTQEVTDKEQLADLTVYKEGEMLTGASVTEDGVTFEYRKQRLKGAVYNVYAAEDIIAADGTKIYAKGALVKEGLVTGSDGSATLSDLHLGSYSVTETKAPDTLLCSGETQTITLSYGGQTVEKVFGSVVFTNERAKAEVSVTKQDDTTNVPLSGGIYGLYATEDIANAAGDVVVTRDTLIEKVTTGEDGSASYHADLPINHSYYMKEIQAPTNYYRNLDARYDFTFQYVSDRQETAKFSYTFENKRVNATIHLVKKDKETGAQPQGDATFEGAVYGLYAREDIVHPDQKTGVLYRAGEQVGTLKTDAAGNAEIKDLYLGKYYVKEITPPVGYLLDEEEHDVECSYEGDLVLTVERTTESSEQVIKQPFQVIKAANNGKTDADLLKGAGFSAWLVSGLKTNDDGSYDFTSADPIVLTADGKTEMVTDEKGHAVSIAIPYGTYVVRETTTPHNYDPVDDFIVTITENHPTEPQTWRVQLDKEFEAKLKIVKKDDETKKAVLIPNTEFKVYDLDHEKYVEQVTTYPVTTTHKSYFTDSDGYLILPNNLKIGNYRIEEVTAPENYTLNNGYVEVSVDANTAYQMDSVSKDTIIEVTYENHPVKGQLVIYKKGEVVKDFKKDFSYEEAYLAGAEFEVYAAENIYTADFQKDESGNRILEYAKDALVTTVTTDADGKAVAENLPLGKYYVKEKHAPEGFVLNTTSQEAEFVYQDQNTPVITEKLTFVNDRQKVSIAVKKQDAENDAAVAGATFGLYTKEDIVNSDGLVVAADTLLEEAVSGEDGMAHFTLDLPLGQYYVKETKAPAGFVSSDEILDLDASYQGQDIPVVFLTTVKKNEPTTISITKADITTGVELDGASLQVINEDGEVVDEWTSVKDEPHIIKRLTVGEVYTLRETFAPYGYLKASEIKFMVSDTVEVQRIEMKDEVPTALLIINKKGEFLDKITLLDNAKGTVEHFFEYISGSLTKVTFEVYAAEEIKAADGVSESYYQKDELVETITTDDNGNAQLGDLPVGKYYVKEVETAHGYLLDGEPRYVDLSYRDQDTPVVTYDEAWQNVRQKVNVTVLKKEKDTDRVLKGGIFGLFTKEDIKSKDGDVLMEADTIIERKSTDDNGQITFVADIPVDGTYYVKELYAPDGFVTTEEMQEFTFEYGGSDQAEISYDFIFENEPTTSEFTKSDLTIGEELPGAHLQVTDKDGNVIDEWVSGTEPHIIKELVVGKEYTLTETIPANGYATAESITFKVENTVEIQKHEMKDDVTKVQISKTDITGGQEVPGASLTILDEDDQIIENWTSTNEPHYIEKLPIGKYTLREEIAPKGYVMTTDVAFEVADTAEIQTVSMKNDTAKGKVILNKTDKDTEKPLKGVEFELRDSKGKVLETLVTDAAGHAESKLYEIASYQNGAYHEPLKYVLVETKNLENYKLDTTEHEVVFEYKDANTPIVEVTYNLTNEYKPGEPGTPTTPSGGNPKTGDDTNLWLPILLLAVSAGSLAGLLAVSKARKRRK